MTIKKILKLQLVIGLAASNSCLSSVGNLVLKRQPISRNSLLLWKVQNIMIMTITILPLKTSKKEYFTVGEVISIKDGVALKKRCFHTNPSRKLGTVVFKFTILLNASRSMMATRNVASRALNAQRGSKDPFNYCLRKRPACFEVRTPKGKDSLKDVIYTGDHLRIKNNPIIGKKKNMYQHPEVIRRECGAEQCPTILCSTPCSPIVGEKSVAHVTHSAEVPGEFSGTVIRTEKLSDNDLANKKYAQYQKTYDTPHDAGNVKSKDPISDQNKTQVLNNIYKENPGLTPLDAPLHEYGGS